MLRAPASVEKLYTATAAAGARWARRRAYSTSVYSERATCSPGGTSGSATCTCGEVATRPSARSELHREPLWGPRHERLDPRRSQLVRKVDGIHHVTGKRSMGDESFFDSRRGEPSSNYKPSTPWLEGTLSALAFNQRCKRLANTGAHAPATYAARELSAGTEERRCQRSPDRAASVPPPPPPQPGRLPTPPPPRSRN